MLMSPESEAWVIRSIACAGPCEGSPHESETLDFHGRLDHFGPGEHTGAIGTDTGSCPWRVLKLSHTQPLCRIRPRIHGKRDCWQSSSSPACIRVASYWFPGQWVSENWPDSPVILQEYRWPGMRAVGVDQPIELCVSGSPFLFLLWSRFVFVIRVFVGPW